MSTTILPRALDLSRSRPLVLVASRTPMQTAGRVACVFVVLFVLLWNLTGYRTYASHEIYVAATAKEMLATGDWIVPRAAEVPRLQKPPLAYWITAGLGALLGGVTPFVTRFPQVLSAIGLAWLMKVWVERLYGQRTGWAAFVIQGTIGYAVYFGRRSEIDMLLCLVTTGSMYLAWRGPLGSERRDVRRWAFWFWSLLATAWMLKFYYGPALTLVPIVLWYAADGRLRRLTDFISVPGMLLFVAAVVTWPLLVLNAHPDAWSVWRYETVDRAVGKIFHVPLWFYLPQLLLLCVPWTIFAFRPAIESWTLAWSRGDSTQRFLWLWLLAVLGIITVQPDKHPNYLLAALPVITFWAAPAAVWTWQRVRKLHLIERNRPLVVCAALTLTCGVSYLFTAPVADTYYEAGQGIYAGTRIMFAFGLAAAFAFRSAKDDVGAYLLVAATLVGYGTVMSCVLPTHDHRADGVAFLEELRKAHPDERIILHDMYLTYPAYYLDAPITRADDDDALRALTSDGEPELVLTYGEFDGGQEYVTEPVQEQPASFRQHHPRLTLTRIRRKSTAP